MKFNEIRSGVLNKISGLDSTRSLARVPPACQNERAPPQKRWVGAEQGRSDYSSQSRDPTEQIEVAVIYDPGDGAGASAAIFHPKVTVVSTQADQKDAMLAKKCYFHLRISAG